MLGLKCVNGGSEETMGTEVGPALFILTEKGDTDLDKYIRYLKISNSQRNNISQGRYIYSQDDIATEGAKEADSDEDFVLLGIHAGVPTSGMVDLHAIFFFAFEVR